MADPGRFQSLALLLAQGCALRDAAQKAGVSERTAYRVVKKPEPSALTSGQVQSWSIGS